MYDLTIIKRNGGCYVDSREVAGLIGKEHRHLLRDIRKYCDIMEKSTEPKFGLSDFFLLSSYLDSTGRELPCYLLSKMGCEMVANKLTGEKGVLFTAAYVAKFNEMEQAERDVANTEPPTLADVIQGILERRAANGNQYAIQNLKAAADMLNFLTANRIMDLQGLDDCFGGMIGRQLEIRDKLKPIDRRLKVLDEHIGQSESYFQYRDIYNQQKAQPPKKQAQFYETHRRELTLYEAANGYLKGVMNGRTTIPTGAWRKERDQKTAEKQQLDLEYKTLKAEVSAAEKIRSAVYSIMAQERRREQPTQTHDMER